MEFRIFLMFAFCCDSGFWVEAFEPKRTELFLNDFFEEKSVSYSIINCWEKRFTARFAQSNLKPKSFIDITSMLVTDFHSKDGNIWIVTDSRNCDVRCALKQMDRKVLFNFPWKHLFLVSSSDLDEYLRVFEKLKILPMSHVVVAVFNENDVKLVQPYKVNITETLILENYGNWSESNRLNEFNNHVAFTSRRRNLNGYHVNMGVILFNNNTQFPSNLEDFRTKHTPLKVMLVVKLDLTIFTDLSLPAEEVLFIHEFPILHALMQRVNTSFTIHRYSSHGYGTALNKTTGRVDGYGMNRDVFDEKLDIAACMFVSKPRLEFLKFLSPLLSWDFQFILQKPALSQMKNIYVLTFPTRLWITTIIFSILFMATMYVILNWESRTFKRKSDRELTKYTVSDITLLSLEAMCQQGTMREPQKISSKLAMLMLFLMFMFIYIAYSASILVLLRTEVTLRDLTALMASRLECGGTDNAYTRYYFKEPKKGILRALYLKKLQSEKSYYDFEEGLKKVQKGNFAFHVSIPNANAYILKHFSYSEICGLQELPGFMHLSLYSVAPRNSQYYEILKVGYLDLIERGISLRAKKRVVAKPTCNNQSGSFRSIRMYDCLPVLIIYAVGVALSFVMLLSETIVKNIADDTSVKEIRIIRKFYRE